MNIQSIDHSGFDIVQVNPGALSISITILLFSKTIRIFHSIRGWGVVLKRMFALILSF
jgi:hypothetical protein